MEEGYPGVKYKPSPLFYTDAFMVEFVDLHKGDTFF